MKVVVAITGASGSAYAMRLLEELSEQCHVILVASEPAKQLIREETDVQFDDLEEMAGEVIENDDISAGICSGSYKSDAMVIVPCSMNTLAKLACGISDNVIARAGSVMLKERRKLILVPRETPLSQINLENMLKLARAGAIVLPAMPGFYGKPESVKEMVDFIVGRILDSLGLENELGPKWGKQ
jgi:4-hydroxy-3-polyprenylbenzoate decarboxylase